MKQLIDKYFEGKTTLEEEARLRNYFQSEEVDESLKPYQSFFRYLESEKEKTLTLSDDFEEKLFRKIDQQNPPGQLHGGRIRILHMVRAIAAIGVLLLAAYLFMKPEKQENVVQTEIDWSKYEIKDEQLALEETEKALKLLSSKLNLGKNKTVEEISKSEPMNKYLN